MNAQELVDVAVLHYNGAADSERISIGHWSRPEWAAPIEHFVPQIVITLGELRGMASPRALAGAEQLRQIKR